MKKYLNTLFVTSQGAHLNKEGESIVVNVDNEVRLRVPVHNLGGIVCFGNVMCTPRLMYHCAKNNVIISFMSEHGRFLTRVQGPVSGNVLLRREQYRRADKTDESIDIARTIVLAKAINSRAVLQRAVRDHPEKMDLKILKDAIHYLKRLCDSVQKEKSIDELRGREGEASSVYFSVLDQLITTQKKDFYFKGRSRRPPMDNMNALMSFIYSLLTHDCIGALEGVGLDPQVGFLHADRPGRPGLALDLMEEFRSFFADRLALSLVNLRQVRGSGFRKTESGAVEMTEETRKTVLSGYQNRKREEMIHPFLKERAPIGLFFHLQSLLLARHLRGDLDGYPAVIWK